MLEPLVGVGPLRFGMNPDEVASALDGAIAHVSQGLAEGTGWGHYTDRGVTAVYGKDSNLVAVAVDAMDGPLVRLGDIDLIARPPSQVRAELQQLAFRENVSVHLNWSGDPEIEAWGISMGAAQEQGRTADGPERYVQRLDTMVTEALLVGPELAKNPFKSEPVSQWRDVRDEPPHPGTWPVRAEQERQRWDWHTAEERRSAQVRHEARGSGCCSGRGTDGPTWPVLLRVTVGRPGPVDPDRGPLRPHGGERPLRQRLQPAPLSAPSPFTGGPDRRSSSRASS
ncbi:hypothetical protein ABXI76_02535 [Streptomyces parvus]